MLRPKLAANPATAMGPIGKVLSAADVAMVNLETAVTTRGTAIPGKAYTFRAPATAFDALRAAGVDVTSMANNHGIDFGPVGLQDSLEAIRTSGFPTVGIGADAASAFAPYRVTVKGQRLAFIGATQVLDGNLVKAWSATDTQPGLASAFDEARLLESVRVARADSDLVVVYLHWGQERNNCPIARQRDIAQKLIDAGADILVGSHAHVLLGSGYLGKAYVNYGLGNFVWYARGGASATTGVLTLTVEGRNVTKSEWTPAFITDGQPIPLTGADAEKAVANWNGLRACTGLSATPS
jgi:poly-gamma-glutamate synthesis protein (capsule biosynthesis protein)